MTTPNDIHGWLSAPTRLSALHQAIRAKIPAIDVDDLVQSTLADALTAPEPPKELAAFERWLFGIARHKIADYYRRHRRHEIVDNEEVDDSAYTDPAAENATDLLRWVDRELPREPETTRTLEWMMREAAGDPLETIAKEHDMAAPTVRQRVSRLRRYLRERWALEVAAALGLLVVVTGLFTYQQSHDRPALLPDPARVPAGERAVAIRKTALEACRAGEWKPCLVGLDRAKTIDPKGDATDEVQAARTGASRALAPTPSPSARPAPSSAPLPSAAPLDNVVPKRMDPPPVKSRLPVEKKLPAPMKSELSFDKTAPASKATPLQTKGKAAFDQRAPTPFDMTTSTPARSAHKTLTPQQPAAKKSAANRNYDSKASSSPPRK